MLCLRQQPTQPCEVVLACMAKKLSTKGDWDKRYVQFTVGGGMPPLLRIFHSESDAKREDALDNATTVVVLGARIAASTLELRDRAIVGN